MNGKELRKWRKEAGISMEDLTAMTGVGKSTISRFENGKEILGTSYALLYSAMEGETKFPKPSKKQRLKRIAQELVAIAESEESE